RVLLRGRGALVGDDRVVEVDRPVVAPLVGATLRSQVAGVAAPAAGADVAGIRLAPADGIVAGPVAAAEDDVEAVAAAGERVGAAHAAAEVEDADLRRRGAVRHHLPRVSIVGALLILVAVAAEPTRVARLADGRLGACGPREKDEGPQGAARGRHGNCTV